MNTEKNQNIAGDPICDERRDSFCISTETESISALLMPGCKKEDISIEVVGDMLKVSSEYQIVLNSESKVDGKYEFSTSIPSNYDIEHIDTKYENGVLYITIPIIPKKRMEIKVK